MIFLHVESIFFLAADGGFLKIVPSLAGERRVLQRRCVRRGNQGRPRHEEGMQRLDSLLETYGRRTLQNMQAAKCQSARCLRETKMRWASRNRSRRGNINFAFSQLPSPPFLSCHTSNEESRAAHDNLEL